MLSPFEQPHSYARSCHTPCHCVPAVSSNIKPTFCYVNNRLCHTAHPSRYRFAQPSQLMIPVPRRQCVPPKWYTAVVVHSWAHHDHATVSSAKCQHQRRLLTGASTAYCTSKYWASHFTAHETRLPTSSLSTSAVRRGTTEGNQGLRNRRLPSAGGSSRLERLRECFVSPGFGCLGVGTERGCIRRRPQVAQPQVRFVVRAVRFKREPDYRWTRLRIHALHF